MSVRSRNYKIIVQRDSKDLTTRVIQLLTDLASLPNQFKAARAELAVYAATSPDVANGTEFFADGLAYVWRQGATVIQDMPNLVPVAPAYLQHWGCTGADTDPGAVVDDTARVQYAAANYIGTIHIDRFFFITDMISPNVMCKLHLTCPPDKGGFVVRGSFNMAAAAVINGPSGVENFAIGDMAIHFGQNAAAASGLRSDLIQYPWAIKFNAARPTLGNVRIVRGWNGISGITNVGGIRGGRLELGGFGMNLEIDEMLDFGVIDQIHCWPFGSAGTPNLANIFYDGETRAYKMGKVEGLVLRQVGTFRAAVEYEGDPAGILPMLTLALQLDGRGARLIQKDGWQRVAMSYSTKNGAPSLPSIDMQGGWLDLTNPHCAGDEAVQIGQSGGVLTINGGHLWQNNQAGRFIDKTGGKLVLNGVTIRGRTDGVRTVSAIRNTGGSITITGLNPIDINATVPLVEITNDDTGNRVDLSNLRYYNVTFPNNATQGVYRTASWVAGPNELVFASRGTASGYVTSNKLGVGQIIRVGNLVWQYDGVSTQIPDMLGVVALNPEVGHWGSSNAAITSMAAAVGYVRFTSAFTITANVTFAVPVYFAPGASLGGAFTATFSNTVTSPVQQIYRNDLTVICVQNLTTGNGENARQYHVSWFGAFPSAISPTVSCEAALQRGFTAMGNTREALAQFDMGNYWMRAGCLVSRGVKFVTADRRRTVFMLDGDGFDAFTTNGVAVKIEGCNVEQPVGATARTRAFFVMNHDDCEARSIRGGYGAKTIVVNGAGCSVFDCYAVYNGAAGAGSSVVELNDGANWFTLDGCDLRSSPAGPEAIVRVNSTAGTLLGLTIRGLKAFTNTVPVILNASGTGVIQGFLIDGGQFDGAASTALVRTITSGSGQIRVGQITNLVGGSGAECALDIVQGGNSVRDILLSGVTLGGPGSVVRTATTAGAISGINVIGVNALARSKISGPVAGITFLDADPNVSMITPYQFGARGDYTTDDTAAIDAWLAYFVSTRRPLWMPRGVFRYHNKRLTLPEGVIINGVGGPRIAAYPQRSPEKDKLRPTLKGTISGAVIIFSGTPADAAFASARSDKYANLNPMVITTGYESIHISGMDFMQDMDVLTSGGVLTTSANDQRAVGYDCGMVNLAYGSRIDVGIFGYFPKSGFINLAKVGDGILDPDYVNLSGSTITSGVAVLGARGATPDTGNTGCKSSMGDFYGADHHTRADTLPDVPVVYVDGDTGGSNSGIRGVSFVNCSLRGYANNAIVLGRCDDFNLTGCTTEFSTVAGVTGLDLPGVILGSPSTGNVTLVGNAATGNLGLAALAVQISGNYFFTQSGEFDTTVMGRGGAGVQAAMTAIRIGGNAQSDPYIQMTNDLSSSTSGWGILRDISDADELDIRWNGSTVLRLATGGDIFAKAPGPYANDAAAATGGVAIGQTYRVTGGTMAYRQA